MGYDCNVQCDYCTITREMRSRNLTTAAIQQALEEGRRDGLTDLAQQLGNRPIGMVPRQFQLAW